MGNVKMVNLYRCSSAERRVTEKEIHFFVTDYFDGIKVESLDLEKTTLAECFGIKHVANVEKKGISYQRYCLFDMEDEDEDIFGIIQDMSLLTIIQVFINPDIYQASSFQDGGEVSCSQCIMKISKYLECVFGERKNLKWKIYRLLTDGDFAIVVRSSRIHDAYDISTLVRSIFLHAEGMQEDVSAFFTYTISGVLDKRIDGKDACGKIGWSKYLDIQDRVIVRICYSHRFSGMLYKKENKEIKESFLSSGDQLLGWYDYQMECTPSEFEEMYSFIRDFKFNKNQIIRETEFSALQEKTQMVLWMLKYGCISRINEKLLLHYEEESLLSESPEYIWQLSCEKEWNSLYEQNNKRIIEVRSSAEETERLLKENYQSARNLKEYVRLLGRLCRILYEINQMQEQRVSVANLLKQLNIMMNSMNGYIKDSEMNGFSGKKIANRVEALLHVGINALEGFTKYIRNINLQTIQTPNFDLQTNVCVEKMLLAYSQFMKPFMEKADGRNEKAYYLNNPLYPIIIPDMSVMSLSVIVLFNYCYPKEKNSDRLMVVFSPTFSYLCESCFLIPAIFHEIAHQFRYENREIRNRNVEKYIFKSFLFGMIRDILEDEKYGITSEAITEEIVEKAYDFTEGKLISEEARKNNFQNFEYELTRVLGGLCAAANKPEANPAISIRQYVDQTKNSVLDYNMEILSAIELIQKTLEKWESNLIKYKEDERLDIEMRDKLNDVLAQYKAVQERQIADAIIALLENIKENHGKNMEEGASKQIKEICEKKTDAIDGEEFGKCLFDIFNKIEKYIPETERLDLKNLLKQYHNIYHTYRTYMITEGELRKGKGREDRKYQKYLSGLSQILYEIILDYLDKYEYKRNRAMDWDEIAISSSQIEYLHKRIIIEKKEGIEKRLRDILSVYGEKYLINNFVHSKSMLYREVTSDLFMCSIMGLNSFGYLVVVAETFAFTEDNKGIQYERVSIVLQCLCSKRNGENLDAAEFEEDLMEILRTELNKLLEGNQELQEVCGVDSFLYQDIETIKKTLVDLRQVRSLTSTQDWILRICWQITVIVKNLKNSQVCCKVIGEKDIWKDLVSKHSYIQNTDKLQKILKENDEVGLCSSISEILNSPTSYFKDRKSITLEEICFIFDKYEKNCRCIMQEQ